MIPMPDSSDAEHSEAEDEEAGWIRNSGESYLAQSKPREERRCGQGNAANQGYRVGTAQLHHRNNGSDDAGIRPSAVALSKSVVTARASLRPQID